MNARMKVKISWEIEEETIGSFGFFHKSVIIKKNRQQLYPMISA